MKVSAITLNNNEYKPRRNFFIKYSNSFMSNIDNGKEAIDKTGKMPPLIDTDADKSKGIETLSIFPKKVVNGRTIITA